MSKEKREKRTYEAIGPVAQQFGAHFMFGSAVPFQRMDNGATVPVRIGSATPVSENGTRTIRFQGTLLGLHEGEAISGEYNVFTQKTTLVT